MPQLRRRRRVTPPPPPPPPVPSAPKKPNNTATHTTTTTVVAAGPSVVPDETPRGVQRAIAAHDLRPGTEGYPIVNFCSGDIVSALGSRRLGAPLYIANLPLKDTWICRHCFVRSWGPKYEGCYFGLCHGGLFCCQTCAGDFESCKNVCDCHNSQDHQIYTSTLEQEQTNTALGRMKKIATCMGKIIYETDKALKSVATVINKKHRHVISLTQSIETLALKLDQIQKLYFVEEDGGAQGGNESSDSE